MPNDDKKPPADKAADPPPPPASPTAAPPEDDSLEQPDTPAPAAEASAQTEPAAKKAGFRSKIPFLNNMYLIIFIAMMLGAGFVVYVSLKSVKPDTATTKLGSLTDQQLTSLKGNTTLVGDSKQTLDVQSNAIFEGQVLMRSDLSVAGTLKVGSGISIPSITVGGAGTFGQVGISGGLNVAGDTTMQGNLAVQKNITVNGSASFGSLNVSQLSITTLGLKGDLNLNQHINAAGGTPGRTNGTALGGGGSASIGGSDTAGTISVNTGSSPPAGCFIAVSFAQKFNATPHVVISPSNSSAAGLEYYTTNRSSTGFSVCTASAPAATTSYTFDYIAIN